jgi:hypothetical protein
LYDPKLLGFRPAPTPASVDNFETANMMTVGKVVHKHNQHGPLHCRKAAVAGG